MVTSRKCKIQSLLLQSVLQPWICTPFQQQLTHGLHLRGLMQRCPKPDLLLPKEHLFVIRGLIHVDFLSEEMLNYIRPPKIRRGRLERVRVLQLCAVAQKLIDVLGRCMGDGWIEDRGDTRTIIGGVGEEEGQDRSRC